MILAAFHPRLVPTFITFAAVLLCLWLGVWQIERLHWKEALIAQREAALAAPPLRLSAGADLYALEFHRVVVSGVFLDDKELLLHAIGPKGEAGFDVLTPLRENGGHTIFVNRGFVLRADRLAHNFGVAQIEGRLRLAPDEKPGWFIPDNRPQEHDWYWIDLVAMAAADGLTDIAPFYIDAGYIDAGAPPPPLPNNHLQYAITWFSLAAVAAVIYVLSQWPRAGRGNAADDDRIR